MGPSHYFIQYRYFTIWEKHSLPSLHYFNMVALFVILCWECLKGNLFCNKHNWKLGFSSNYIFVNGFESGTTIISGKTSILRQLLIDFCISCNQCLSVRTETKTVTLK
jgi:hypothetical protein